MNSPFGSDAMANESTHPETPDRSSLGPPPAYSPRTTTIEPDDQDISPVTPPHNNETNNSYTPSYMNNAPFQPAPTASKPHTSNHEVKNYNPSANPTYDYANYNPSSSTSHLSPKARRTLTKLESQMRNVDTEADAKSSKGPERKEAIDAQRKTKTEKILDEMERVRRTGSGKGKGCCWCCC